MKGKNLIILAVVAAVLVAAALWRTRKGEEAPPDLIGKPVLSELPVNDISKLVVVSMQLPPQQLAARLEKTPSGE